MKETTMNLRVDPVVKQDTEARGLFLPAVKFDSKILFSNFGKILISANRLGIIQRRGENYEAD